MRSVICFVALVVLAPPLVAGELDEEFGPKAIPGAKAARAANGPAAAIAPGDRSPSRVAGASELDAEGPTPAWRHFGGFGFGGFGYRGFGYRGFGYRGFGFPGWGGGYGRGFGYRGFGYPFGLGFGWGGLGLGYGGFGYPWGGYGGFGYGGFGYGGFGYGGLGYGGLGYGGLGYGGLGYGGLGYGAFRPVGFYSPWMGYGFGCW